MITWTGNYIGRCKTKGCKHTTLREGSMAPGQCSDHGSYRLAQVIGQHANVKCGAKCLNAVGPACDCSCGGKNHGVGHAR